MAFLHLIIHMAWCAWWFSSYFYLELLIRYTISRTHRVDHVLLHRPDIVTAWIPNGNGSSTRLTSCIDRSSSGFPPCDLFSTCIKNLFGKPARAANGTQSLERLVEIPLPGGRRMIQSRCCRRVIKACGIECPSRPVESMSWDLGMIMIINSRVPCPQTGSGG